MKLMKIVMNKEITWRTTQTGHLLPHQHQSDDYSNSDSTNHAVNLRSPGSLSSRSSIREPRYRVPSSAMPSFKIPPVGGETNIPNLRAAIRGLAFCLGADLNSRFDPAFHQGARGCAWSTICEVGEHPP
jgi:hypothetical protein